MKPIFPLALLLAFLPLNCAALMAQSPILGSTPSGAPAGAGRSGTGVIFGSDALYGGVPSGQASAEELHLSIEDVIQRGLKYNLGLLLGKNSIMAAQGSRLTALSDLLPSITAGISEARKQVNLAAVGFTGFYGLNPIVGPFNVFDARVYLNQPVLDFTAHSRLKAEDEKIKAAEHSYKDTRDLVVLVCGNLYLQTVAAQSRIESVRAQVQTAKSLHELAQDRKKAGLAAGIDELRALVQLQTHQQRLIVVENDLEKLKLVLARTIGLPTGQRFVLSDRMPFIPLSGATPDSALETAYRSRGDYLSMLDAVRAAELEKEAVQRERWPSLDFDADYGDIGSEPAKSHGTFSVAASLRIPVFDRGRTKGKLLEAEARLRQRRDEAEDMRARIYYEIQTAFMNLKAAGERVKTAESTKALAQEEIIQVRDRFAAGVANTVEVVQAQESLAGSDENYISSLYEFNLAKATLARAMGTGEEIYLKLFRGK